MIICPLLSGSSGNATYVASGNARVLVDCGASGRAIETCLRKINVDPRTITHLLVTHAHSDHVCGLGVFSRRYNLPVYASVGAWEEILGQSRIGRIAKENIKVFNVDSDEKTLCLGDLSARFFSTPHDSKGSVGYVLSDNRVSFGIATDFGVVTEEIQKNLTGCRAVLLEANHDVDMLRNGPYPYVLQQRILSNYGHLSNVAAAAFAIRLVQTGARHVYLGHLSQENNTPEIALQTVLGALKDYAETNQPLEYSLYLARRYEPSFKLDL